VGRGPCQGSLHRRLLAAPGSDSPIPLVLQAPGTAASSLVATPRQQTSAADLGILSNVMMYPSSVVTGKRSKGYLHSAGPGRALEPQQDQRTTDSVEPPGKKD